jgi:urease accessory protein
LSAVSDTAWIANLLQLSDTFYPTGSYAHSFGLEGLVQDGFIRDRDSLRAFLLEQALPALARTDLIVAAAAWAAAGEPADLEAIAEFCTLGSALRGAREPREASEAIGRQRLELLAARPQASALVLALQARGGSTPSSVIAAIEARSIGAPVEAALSALIYSAAAGLLAAAVKLLRLGQNAVQSLLTEALALAPRLIATALATPLTEAGAFTPWWDVAAARHERADFRLFIS